MTEITRRRFGQVCMLGLSAMGLSAMGTAKAQPFERVVALPHGGSAPALGMGSWQLAQGRHPAAGEEDALRTGLGLGMRLIDTAEMYGDGRSETMIGRVIAGRRDKVFLVSKVLPSNATSAADIRHACAGSLARLKTDHLDLYLLHWRGGLHRLDIVVRTF